MKKIFLTAVISFAVIVGLNAQGRMSMEDRVKMMKHTLALSDSQSVIVDSIFASAGDKIKNVDASSPDRRAAIRKIMDDVNTQVESILTPEQKDKYESMMAERRSRMRKPSDSGN